MNKFKNIREQFPLFSMSLNNDRLDSDRPAIKSRLAYLDSAASAQKPKVVIDRITQYLSFEHANIHRGAYSLSANATTMYEEARESVARFIGAKSSQEIVFTKGTTESINLVSNSLSQHFTNQDTVLISELEHHSNIVPWQVLKDKTGCRLEFLEITPKGEIDTKLAIEKIKELKPKLIALTQLSNLFGTKVAVEEIAREAKKVGSWVLIDAAQSIVHQKVNLKELEADFLTFSGHKLYGPTGIGILFVRENMYELMQPYQVGGGMISKVSINGTTWAEGPKKYEAGTPPIGGAIGLKTAIEFVGELGVKEIADYEDEILFKAIELLKKENHIELYGPIADNNSSEDLRKKVSSIVSFNVKGVHPHDIATICDSHNVQVRAGHHCAMPALEKLKIPGTVRASIGVYSTVEDFQMLIEATREAKSIFA